METKIFVGVAQGFFRILFQLYHCIGPTSNSASYKHYTINADLQKEIKVIS